MLSCVGCGAEEFISSGLNLLLYAGADLGFCNCGAEEFASLD